MEILNKLDMQAVLLLRIWGGMVFGIFGTIFVITLIRIIKSWIKGGNIWQ